MRQAGGGVFRLNTPIVCCIFPEEGRVEKPLSYQATREVLQQVAPQYREASSSQKRMLLDAFVATTGYHRTYASMQPYKPPVVGKRQHCQRVSAARGHRSHDFSRSACLWHAPLALYWPGENALATSWHCRCH